MVDLSNSKRGPSFLIIGGQKCGTTALHSYLSLHPKISGSEPKELHFFNSDYNYNKGFLYYESKFSNLGDKTISFEASPSYLVNASAPQRIFNYNPRVRLIVLLRNPVERAFSAWNMYKKRYQLNRNWFRDDWIANVEPSMYYYQRSDSSLFDFTKYVTEELNFYRQFNEGLLEGSVIDHGYYYKQIRRYLDLFDINQIYFCTTSRLKKQTVGVLREMVYFLGVDPIDWSSLDLAPVFEGQYNQGIPVDAKNILMAEYEEDSKNLVAFLGLKGDADFEWIKPN